MIIPYQVTGAWSLSIGVKIAMHTPTSQLRSDLWSDR